MKLSNSQKAQYEDGELVTVAEALAITGLCVRELMISRFRRLKTADGITLFYRVDLYVALWAEMEL